MALQGTLDTFELPDVLRLLASTSKTGRLRMQTDRGDGDVWLAGGQVVGIEAPNADADDLDDGLFQLLRARDGAFAFEPGAEPDSWRAAADVEPLLASAESRLAEWRELEAVVPSLGAWVALAPELPGPEVTVDAATWRIVATVAGGLTVAELGDLLGIGELAVCRLVRDLVALGIGEVAAPPAHAARARAQAEPEVQAAEPAPVEEPEPAAEPEVAELYAPQPAWPVYGDVTDEPVVDAEVVEPEPFAGPDAGASDPMPAVSAFDRTDPAEAEDVARQLSMLSPRAAQAVAATAASTSDADRDAALAAVDGEEPINRGLLLKFLGSVKG